MWAMLDRYVSTRCDLATTCSPECRTGQGNPFRISLRLSTPPAVSRLYLHMPTGAAETHCRILASHRDALLLSMYEPFTEPVDGQGMPRFYDQELFVYIAGGSTPSLTLLPPCCTGSIMDYASDNSSFTSDGVASWLASDDDDAYDDQQQPEEETGPLTGITQFELQAVGIYRHDDDNNYVVAYLCVSRCITPGSQAKDVEAQMCLYYSSESRWELHALPISHHHHKDISELTRWSCSKVITFGTYLCWIDYNCGILFWDVSAELLQVTFLKLPVGAHLFPEACMDMYRNICVVRDEQDQGNNKKLKFIDVRPYHGYYFRPPPNSSHFELNIWTLAIDGDDGNNMMMSWVHEFMIRDHELRISDLVPSPHGPLMFPVMSTEEPHIAYFMVRPYGYFVNKTWIVPVDLNGTSAKDAFLYLKGEEDLLGDDADTTRTNAHCFEPFLTCDVNLF